MKYNLTGIWENVYICRYISSVLLSEFEATALNFAGIPSTSSVNFIFNNIVNQKNFTVTSFEEHIIIQIDGNEEYQLKLNLSNGEMYGLSIFNNFLYKGAISNFTDNYCFHDFLIDTNIKNITKYYNKNSSNENITISDRDIKFFEEVLSDFSLASAAVMMSNILLFMGVLSPPVLVGSVIVVMTLVTVGVFIKYHLNGGNINEAIGDSIVSIVPNWF